MSFFSYVLMKSSYNFGGMISCFRFHMPPIFVDCPMTNDGSLLLAGTAVVWSGGFGKSFWVGEYFKLLIWSVIASRIALNYFVIFIIFSSDSCRLDFISSLLASISACMMMNCSSGFFFILLPPLGILKLEVRRSVSQK